MMSQVYNFSSGPAMLPSEVLLRAQQELLNWNDLGSSVMEISHRSQAFRDLAAQSEQDLRELLSIPASYKVLFCQGGARAQFAAVPANLLGNAQHADYADGGYWAQSAIKEAYKYCEPKVLSIKTTEQGKQSILPMSEWKTSANTAYLHYCPNETIDGIAIDEQPDFGLTPVVADFSSTILSRPIDIERYALIYAGAQKNIGPSGLTLVILREELLGRCQPSLPSILNYQLLAENDSMYNTPPTFAWYLSGKVFEWLKAQGGLAEIDKRNQQKSSLLYSTIDKSDFYHNNVSERNRSRMNVPFTLARPELDGLFLEQATAAGLMALKGHRASGGMRASIYNAMPLEGVKVLTDFMHYFEQKNG